MEKKPGLAILIGQALAKKGKAKSAGVADEEDKGEYKDDEDADAHLQEIADDMLKAIEEKDSGALKDLLREAFECLEAEPHEEGPHEDDEESY